MQSNLERKYQELFNKFGINEKTGCLKDTPQIKFPTFPYIGSEYGHSKKILIVGLDIGADEKIGGIQSFEERRQAIEDKSLSKHNPHIAGTYFTALFLLKEELHLQDYWEKLKKISSCQKALQINEELPSSNPLSYVTLTNYYKFVSINRTNRTGGENRVHFDSKMELDFFIQEVRIFNPDIIVLQSQSFKSKKELLRKLLALKKRVYVSPHPAYRGKREPDYFLRKIVEIT